VTDIQPEVICISSDSENESPVKRLKTKQRDSADSSPKLEESGELSCITRQLRARVVDINQLPRCWPIQRDGTTIAFRLDLSKEDRDWTDEHGKEIGMLLAIRQGVWILFYIPLLTNKLGRTRIIGAAVGHMWQICPNVPLCLRWEALGASVSG
jgi:hypothetical protein